MASDEKALISWRREAVEMLDWSFLISPGPFEGPIDLDEFLFGLPEPLPEPDVVTHD